MNLNEAKNSYDGFLLASVRVVPNTVEKGEWLIFIKDKKGKSYFLVSENDEVISFKSIDNAIDTIRQIGFRRAKVFF